MVNRINLLPVQIIKIHKFIVVLHLVFNHAYSIQNIKVFIYFLNSSGLMVDNFIPNNSNQETHLLHLLIILSFFSYYHFYCLII